MREIERILDQLGRSFSGDAWYGPSVQQVVAGVSVYVTLHGIIQHNVYHAAQIALLKRGFAAKD